MNTRCEFTTSEADSKPLSAVFQTVLDIKNFKHVVLRIYFNLNTSYFPACEFLIAPQFQNL
jgi:hypothetical protein